MSTNPRQAEKATDRRTEEDHRIAAGDVVTDKFTGRLLTVTAIQELENHRYISAEFVESTEESTQTRHVDDVEPEGSL